MEAQSRSGESQVALSARCGGAGRAGVSCGARGRGVSALGVEVADGRQRAGTHMSHMRDERFGIWQLRDLEAGMRGPKTT